MTQWVTWLTVVGWGGLARPRGPLSKPPWADELVGLLPGLLQGDPTDWEQGAQGLGREVAGEAWGPQDVAEAQACELGTAQEPL